MVPVTPKPNAASNVTVTAAADAAKPDSTPANGKNLDVYGFCLVTFECVLRTSAYMLLSLQINQVFLLVLLFLGPPKTEAQLKKEAKKREKMEKFQQKKEMEEKKKKTQPQTEVE